MLFVGIDVAKSHHDVAILDHDGTIILRHLRIQNTRLGFELLINKLNDLTNKLHQPVRIAMESTGHYSTNIMMFMQSHGYATFLYNPFLIKEFVKSASLRKTKTDKADSLTIAKKLASDVTPEQFAISHEIQELKILSRYRSRLTTRRADLKTQYIRLLDISFPELASFFGNHNLHTQYIYDLLIRYSSPHQIAHTRIDVLTKMLHGQGNHLESAKQLKNLARQSIGLKSTANELELKQTLTMIKMFSTQIDTVDQQINQLMDSLEDARIMTSISGISNRIGSVILAEINNIRNFNSPEQLLAFAGLEPSIYQSGQLETTGKMVKRGSTALRWALYQAAEYASRWSPTIRAYRQKKLKKGKHFYVVMSHVAKKLVRIIYYLLKHQEYFDEIKLS